jgi:hypothetical protein
MARRRGNRLVELPRGEVGMGPTKSGLIAWRYDHRAAKTGVCPALVVGARQVALHAPSLSRPEYRSEAGHPRVLAVRVVWREADALAS